MTVGLVFIIMTDLALRSSSWLREYLDGTLGIRKVKGQFKLQPETGVVFDDVAGVDEAKAELLEIVDFLK